jgi:thiol-disulfide isomerase/thioredoxin
MDLSLTREIRVPVGDPKLARIDIEKFLIVSLGETAPELTGQTLDGKEIKLSDLRGKVVLLDFWATWCGPCIQEMPHVRRAYEKYSKQGDFVVIGISLDEDAGKVRSFVKQRKVGWPQIVGGPAKESAIAKAYFVEGIPASFLIDRDGKVVAKDLRGKDVLRKVRKALRAGKPTERQADSSDEQAARNPRDEPR